MKENFVTKGFLFVFIMGISLIFLGCPTRNPLDSQNDSEAKNTRQDNMESSPENTETISKDIDELAKNINLPVRPAEAVWKKKTLGNPESTIPGPSDYLLVAVLKYDEAEIEKIIEQTKEKPVKGVVQTEDWFPEDLKNLAQDFENEKLLSGEKYDTKSFARSPYLNGTILRVNGSNYFVLTLFSM